MIKDRTMLVIKEQQERLLKKYIEENHTYKECLAFVDGLKAMLELIDKIMKNDNDKESSTIKSKV